MIKHDKNRIKNLKFLKLFSKENFPFFPKDFFESKVYSLFKGFPEKESLIDNNYKSVDFWGHSQTVFHFAPLSVSFDHSFWSYEYWENELSQEDNDKRFKAYHLLTRVSLDLWLGLFSAVYDFFRYFPLVGGILGKEEIFLLDLWFKLPPVIDELIKILLSENLLFDFTFDTFEYERVDLDKLLGIVPYTLWPKRKPWPIDLSENDKLVVQNFSRSDHFAYLVTFCLYRKDNEKLFFFYFKEKGEIGELEELEDIFWRKAKEWELSEICLKFLCANPPMLLDRVRIFSEIMMAHRRGISLDDYKKHISDFSKQSLDKLN